MNNLFYIALGGNIGDVYNTFREVLSRLSVFGEVVTQSKIYQSKPLPTYEGVSQDPYLNAVVLFRTDLSPHDTLKKLMSIENALGRDRATSIHWGPRTIDLDIIFYQDKIILDEDLQIPHPRLYQRDFVLIPIADINPDFVDPHSNKTIHELIQELPDTHIYIEKVYSESI